MRTVCGLLWVLLVACGGGGGGGGGDAAADAVGTDISELGEDVAVQAPPPGDERFVLDDAGAALLLHGINVISAAKSDPERLARIDASDVERIAGRWGFNFVRLLIFWDAVEPRPGEFDQAYLDAVAARVDLFHARGVHVMLDMHQDVYAARFCCDGAPEWAIRDDGEPFELQSQWFANYYQPAVMRAFDNFWAHDGPHADLQEHFAKAWVAVAERFRDHPGVLGYDLINEPFPGSLFDIFEAATRKSPADGGTSRQFDEELLGPFYQRLVNRIRAVDKDAWLFFESRYGAPGNGSPCYLPQLTDPREGGPRLVYAPHLYSVLLEAKNAYGASDLTIPEWEREREADAERLRTPVLAGEWGLAWGADGADRFTREVVEMADRQMMGWAYWSYDASGPSGWAPWDASTGEDNPMAAVLVRPYPRRVTGRPVRYDFDTDTGVFTLELVADPTIAGDTEIFLPPARYGAGYELTVNGAASGSWTSRWDAARNVLSIAWVDAESVALTVRPQSTTNQP